MYSTTTPDATSIVHMRKMMIQISCTSANLHVFVKGEIFAANQLKGALYAFHTSIINHGLQIGLYNLISYSFDTI